MKSSLEMPVMDQRTDRHTDGTKFIGPLSALPGVQKGITIVNAFQSILDSSKRKPNKIWVDQGHEYITALLKNGYKTIT